MEGILDKLAGKEGRNNEELNERMSDIFLSYSRKDAEQATELAARLRERGVEVWIDKLGIEAAKSWSKEIVRAIDECRAFVVLVSDNAQRSTNVSREVGLASEARKPMLPVMLEDIKLSDELRYHLSGIQRVAYTQFDAIAAALAGFGLQTQAPRHRVEKDAEKRKSLMVLPLEDLSPTQDNGWFADGIMSELISSLSHVKALRLIDQKTTLEFKKFAGKTTDIAWELDVRYFVEGSVRKFGEAIRVNVQLLDIEEGEYLWQYQMKGEMKDIFDIQEQVALKVVEGLKIHLSKEEETKLEERVAEDEEVWQQMWQTQTKDEIEQTIELAERGYNRAREGFDALLKEFDSSRTTPTTPQPPPNSLRE